MMKTAKQVVDIMYNGDAFSQWLGITRLQEKPGYCKLQMTIREEMTNGFKIAHGGISYSLADSALAFASNGYGTQAVSIETSISHTKPLYTGDIITAEAIEVNQTRKTALYDVKVKNQKNELIAVFKGTVYRTGKEW